VAVACVWLFLFISVNFSTSLFGLLNKILSLYSNCAISFTVHKKQYSFCYKSNAGLFYLLSLAFE